MSKPLSIDDVGKSFDLSKELDSALASRDLFANRPRTEKEKQDVLDRVEAATFVNSDKGYTESTPEAVMKFSDKRAQRDPEEDERVRAELADLMPAYTQEQVDIMNAELQHEAEVLEHNTQQAKMIYANTERWIASGADEVNNMSVSDIAHGAVWHAMMEQSREAAEAAGYVNDVKEVFQVYADLRDAKRIDHFNTMLQNYRMLFT